MKYRFHSIIVCLSLSFFNACKAYQKEVPVTTIRFNNLGELGVHSVVQFPDDSVERDIPNLYRDNVLYRERRKIDSALSIGIIENGFDSQQIRINGNEYQEYKHGWNRFLIFTHKGSWSADLYYLRFAVEDGFIPTIDSMQYQKHSLGVPGIGWSAFIDSINHLGLLTLSDYAAVPEYGRDLHTDEISYEVEIASSRKYRIYSYPGASERVKKFAEAKRFMQIIGFIKDQYAFPEPWTPKEKEENKKNQ